MIKVDIQQLNIYNNELGWIQEKINEYFFSLMLGQHETRLDTIHAWVEGAVDRVIGQLQPGVNEEVRLSVGKHLFQAAWEYMDHAMMNACESYRTTRVSFELIPLVDVLKRNSEVDQKTG